MSKLTEEQEDYLRKRQEEIDRIEKFIIHFGNISIECKDTQYFKIKRDYQWILNRTISISVYDLRKGDYVDICGSRGEITKIEEVEGVKKLGRADLFGPCVRYGSMKMDEKHPCYICGYPIPVTLEYCKCGIIKCPKCGTCACPSSMREEVFEALVKLRNKYCCNPINFARGLDLIYNKKEKELLGLVPNYHTAFNYCRNLEIKAARKL